MRKAGQLFPRIPQQAGVCRKPRVRKATPTSLAGWFWKEGSQDEGKGWEVRDNKGDGSGNGLAVEKKTLVQDTVRAMRMGKRTGK